MVNSSGSGLGDGPIAIVGMACRLPKASNPREFWQLLHSGGSGVTPVPGGRWTGLAGPDAELLRYGGFVDDVDRFDAEFFGISPREAAVMDPQQRLALELGWEAFEDAGLVPARLRGRRVGVFAGAMAADYELLSLRRGAIGHHSLTGLRTGMIPNRMSYAFGFTGPSLAVDTGQSSSLVAVHLAAESIRSGESDLALAGGIQLNLAGDNAVTTARFGGLSPDGRCFTFDARANGYVRGEGGGFVVLKPLSLALEDGDDVYAVLLGSAVNNEGPGESFTRPSAEAQEAVLRAAYRRAGVDPGRVQYVELHGTGTKVGDPIEARALGAALGEGRTTPLSVGSAKTNVGHLESAAGIVGLVKTALAVRNRRLPASLNFEQPNPDIRFDEWQLRVVPSAEAWPEVEGPLLAGVSSFGVGGTNCHVVLSSPHPAAPAREHTGMPSAESVVPVLVSGRSQAALRDQAARLADALDAEAGLAVADLAWSSALTRSGFEHRAVVVTGDRAEASAGLRALAAGEPDPAVVTGVAAPSRGVVFVFPGQGSQWPGMGRGLLETSPVFRQSMLECQEALAPWVSWSLIDVLTGTDGTDGAALDRVDVVQPALWAIMVSLSRLWRSCGVEPDAVVGHSQGEIAAACVAGALSLSDGARVVALRARALRTLAGRGGMLSVDLSRDGVEEWLGRYPGRVSLAAVNATGSVVLAGEPEALRLLRDELTAQDIRARLVDVDYASHSAQVDEVRAEVLEALAPIEPRPARVPFFSTVDAGWLRGTEVDAAYWFRNLRQTVLFDPAIATLLAEGHRAFVEVSPHPVTTVPIAQTVDAAAVPAVVTGTLRRDQDSPRRFLVSLASLHAGGVELDWPRVFAGLGVRGRRVGLPTYAFQRERYWLEEPEIPAPIAAAPAASRPAEAPREPVLAVRDVVARETAAVLGLRDWRRVDDRRTFKDLGFDSIMMVELRDRVNRALGARLDTTEIFSHPTAAQLSERVELDLGLRTPDTGSAAPAAAEAGDPIVIVGTACRFPGGVASPEDLWDVVATGRDVISGFPADRGWDLAALRDGGSATELGGFLHDAPEFDAGFFGISPREALAMDPQQRLLLETSWEALERANITPASLEGTRAGVFVGAYAQGYLQRRARTDDELAGYLLTGTSSSVMSGRVAYALGLAGPAVTVDTACSSSLVALHLAVQSLRSGESDLALVGGVTVMSEPDIFEEFSRQGGLAPDGRCKPFADSADGTGWSEGTGVLVVERLSTARAQGHRVLAVVRGTAINQDGASNGLTAPNGTAQQRVIRDALARAGLSGADVDAVEAHGTGTRLGDPIEAQALLATLGQGRGEGEPVWLGSVKSNIGHTQAAAGVAGVIKMVEAMRHGVLPRSLHAERPTTRVDWDSGAVRVLTEQVRWPETGRPRRAGVSAFGISGTNAHVILEQPPAEPALAVRPEVHTPVPIVVSGQSEPALRAQAARLAAFVERAPEVAQADLAWSLVTARSTFDHRAVVVPADRAGLLSSLAALAGGDRTGVVPGSTGRVALVFSGQGAQRVGMGRALAARFPVFAEALDEVCALLDPVLAGESALREVMFGEAELLDQTGYTQPALFAWQTAWSRLLVSWGIRPDFVLGHSIGEIAAAHAAGVFSLEDACTLVAARANLMQALPAGGAMLAVSAADSEIAPLLEDYDGTVGIAAVNAGHAVVLSGDEAAVADLGRLLGERGHKTTRLRVSHAFHSARMDPMLAEFRAAIAGISFHEPVVPLVANLTGEIAGPEVSTVDYWVRHVREPVRFAAGVATVDGRGARVFVEAGPASTLASMLGAELDPERASVIPAVRKDQDEVTGALDAVARLHALGATVDWAEVFAGLAVEGRHVAVPTYAFQRERFWPATADSAGDVGSAGLEPVDHPLLGAGTALPDADGHVFSGRLSTATRPWLADHAANGVVLLPGTAFVEVVIRAGDAVGCGRIDDLTLHEPLVLPEDDAVDLQVLVGGPEADGARAVTVYSRPAGQDDSWTRHASGTVTPTADVEAVEAGADLAWPPRNATPVSLDGFYGSAGRSAFDYGPVFQGLQAVWTRGSEVFAEVAVPAAARELVPRFGLHPALLDAVLQANVFAPLAPAEHGRMPFSFSGVTLHATGATTLRVRLTATGEDLIRVDAVDPAGAPVITIESLALRPFAPELLSRAAAAGAPETLLRLDWTAVPAPSPAAAGTWWALAGFHGEIPDGLDVANDVAELVAAGARDVVVPVAGSGGDPEGTSSGDIAEETRAMTAAVLDLLRSWLAQPALAEARLVFLTRRAVGTTDAEPVEDLAAAAVWGLVRSAQTEHPDRFTLLDHDRLLLTPARLTTAEPQSALRGDRTLVPRLAVASDAELLALPADSGAVDDAPAAWRLAVSEPGTVDNLVLRAAPDLTEPLGPGQVRIAVRVAGLNFRDVLNALGMYPGDPVPLGLEVAGVVTETGPEVTELTVGDRVLGIAPGGLGPVAVADQRSLVAVPRQWSFAQAATAPVVFLTAWHGLRDLAGLRAGESVLIHAGAGGVGMAAIRLARHLGAEVFATASPGKWAVLRSLGLPDDHLASSRTADFEARFSAATGGRGVDVVLNSLTGEFVDASLRLLAPGGRFVEMGKVDLRAAHEVAAAHPGVFYQAFDLMEVDLDRIHRMLAELAGLFASGALVPLPVKTWDVRRAPEAFRFVSQAKHVGKVALTIPRAPDPEGAVVITGGTGGLGAAVARHFVERRGARRLVLISRRGEAAPGAAELRAELAAHGAEVVIEACDVADHDRLAEVLAAARPVTAVVHTAGVVADATVESLTPEALGRVLAPKVRGAWHLHELTRDTDLAAFVLFSSIGGVTGAAGQANYAAANGFLDALASLRRGEGRPAVSVAWGAWSPEAGMTAALSEVDLHRLTRSGLPPLTVEQGLALFDRALAADRPLSVATRLDRKAVSAQPSRLFEALTTRPAARIGAATEDPASAEAGVSMARRLAALTPADRARTLTNLVRAEVAAVLGHAVPGDLDPAQAFKELGMDSLTSVELRNRVNKVFGIRLPATEIFNHPTTAQLADRVGGELGLRQEEAAPAVTAVRVLDDDPIVIVGMGCRFPGGADSPEDLWDLVAAGRDAISGFPADRGWDLAALRGGGSATAQGGFLHEAPDFDADFFGISPREALAMDPQQRLLLEVSWEALERAGIAPDSVGGTRAGVFVGAYHQDYLRERTPARDELGGYLLTGTTSSVLSGRIAYSLGLEGPAVTVDTACSSSLVALHWAAQSLRSGECDLALVGGVTVMSTPDIFEEFSRQDGLSADGRCKPFADAADGTGWGEGVGVLVVERMSAARAAEHRVLAVVRGSAVNQDGASNGLTAPNGPSQQRVITAALAKAGVRAAEIDAVEAHGTGTRLGDPIEAQALLATLGQGREEDRPLWLGSVKSNIGHTQAAAGVAGIIKMVQAMAHGILPRSLHVDEPSSRVDWTSGAVRVLTEQVAWPETGRPRRAGVSGFGISGTNAHVILEQAPGEPASVSTVDTTRTAEAADLAETPVPVPVSGRSDSAVREQAARLVRLLERKPDLAVADLAWSLATTRSSLDHRAVVVAADRAELAPKLRALAAGEPDPAVVTGTAATSGGVVFVFPGQGSQWTGMGRELLETAPVFREWILKCQDALAPWVDWSLVDVLTGDSAEPADRVDVVQPVLWAMMVSLAQLWRSFGVQPDAVVGHSQGEIAAACVAGALSLEDGARVVALRAQALLEIAGQGGMLSVALSPDEVQPWLDREEGRVSPAAINAAASVVLAGDAPALERLREEMTEQGIRARRVEVDYASHSPAVEQVRDRVLAALAPITRRTADLKFLSTVDTSWHDGTELDAYYWYRNLRRTVRFEPAVRKLLADGYQTFVEVSAHPVLTVPLAETIEDAGARAVVTGTLRRDRGSVRRVLTSLAAVHTAGVAIDWPRVFGTGRRRVELPTYAFQHQRFWPTSEPAEALAGWGYDVVWTPAPQPAPAQPSGVWWLVVPGGCEAAPSVTALRRELADAGATAELVVVAPGRADRATLAARFGEPATPTGVVSFLAWPDTSVADGAEVPRGLALTATLLQALGDASIQAPVWVVTRGAIGVADLAEVAHPAQTAIWGWGRTAAVEYPRRWGGLIDVPADDADPGLAASVAQILRSGGGTEDQLAVRASGIWARRLAHRDLPPADGSDWEFPAGGSVLVTGGTGALGAHVARWLATGGVPHLVLVSRRGPAAPGAAELEAELTALGARVTVVAGDAADREAMAEVIAAIPADLPLAGVVHTAVVVDDGIIDTVTGEQRTAVFRPKVEAAVVLHELTRDLDLAMFVMFSSISATLGGVGLSTYAAANAYLDGLAQHRRAHGLPATSVAWGTWSGDGLASASAAQQNLRRFGMITMAPDAALEALRRVLGRGEATAVIADVDWRQYLAVFTAARPSPLLGDLPETRQSSTDPEDTGANLALDPAVRLRTRLAGLARTDQVRIVLDLVRVQLAAILGYGDAEPIPENRAFRDLGFDSLTAVELRNILSMATGLDLPRTLVFDYPTPTDLARHLLDELAEPEVSAPAVLVPAQPHPDDDPIVVVGMGCRFPGGVTSPEELWDLVADGADAISEFPADRGWDLAGLHAGGSTTRLGGFLDEVAGFDAGFFGISPREALAMDPQQRLLLETSWEALERAGIKPGSLRGTRTGVFVGSSIQDYIHASMQVREDLEGYLLTGSSSSVLSGRVAYLLGLEGPAITVDTACSSSLVTLHLAAQSLLSGECDLALAGGVTVMSTAELFLDFTRQGALSVDGRCKAFAETADGAGFSEGVGVLAVERLSSARAAGRRVLAVVRGSAVNQDGASNGLTAPNGPSQQRVITAALARAGVSAREIDAVEAHGTGTRLGDPIEAQALLATLGQDREDGRPVWLGSVKSNIGHTQAAAGVAGIIKMVQAMRHGVLPRTLHVDEPTTHVDWAAGAVRVLTEQIPWPETGRPRRAGVSGFGISGTNAHVILEQAPGEPESVTAVTTMDTADTGEAGVPVPIVLSGQSEAAVRAQAARLADFVDRETGVAVPDVAWSSVTTRSAFDHRAVVVAADRAEAVASLRALAAGEPGPGAVTGEARAGGGVVFVFPGQGSQWAGMGRELLATSAVFRESLRECQDALAPWVSWSLTEVLDRADLLERVDVVQPALWAVNVSLAKLWRSHGVEPGAVIGHSQGEIAAACVAGALSLEDGARVVALRAQALRVLAGHGGMLSVALSQDDAREWLARYEGQLSLAAVNAPGSVVVAGDTAALAHLQEELTRQDIRARRIEVDYASHSPEVEQVRVQVLEKLAPITPRPAEVKFFSTVDEKWLDGTELDADYWYRNLRRTVRFEPAVRALLADGYRAFVEVSSHPVTTVPLTETADAAGTPVVVTGTLRRDQGSPRRFLTSLAGLFAAGTELDWAAVFAGLGTGGKPVDLPTYAFQHQRYWPELTVRSVAGSPVEDLVLTLDWITAPEPAGAEAGTWWLLGDHDGASDLPAEPGISRVVDDLGELGKLLAAGDRAPDALLVPVRGPAGDLTTAVEALTVEVLVLLQQWLAEPEFAGTRLVFLTRDAVSAEAAPDPAAAAIWGLVKSAQAEHPDRFTLVDHDRHPLSGESLAAALATGEPQVAIRDGRVTVPRLAPAAEPDSPAPVRWDRGTVVITGGTGGLGAALARHLVASGRVTRLLLLNRRGLDAPGAEQLRAELIDLGAEVTIAACDLADRARLAEALDAVRPVSAVVHTAVQVADGTIESLTPEAVGRVFEAKVRGAWHLHELTRGDDLAAFVLFSAMAGVMGTPGQGNYAAANMFLDALARHRRAAGLPAVSMDWGTWTSDVGLASALSETDLRRLARTGFPAMGIDDGLALFDRAMTVDGPVVAPARVDRVAAAAQPSRMLENLVVRRPEPGDTAAEPEAGPRLAERLTAMTPTDRVRTMTDLVRGQVAAVLGHATPDDVQPTQAFKDIGMDSLTSVELRNRLNEATGLRLPTTIAFDNPNPEVLAGHLVGELIGTTAVAVAVTGSVTTRLDALETTFLTIALDTSARPMLRKRLRALLGRIDDDTTTTETPVSTVDTATDEDLFAMLDDQLGQ
ncbi:SDR family NAD(P)-dependent oxidoreductase [Amycolatopsis rhabdoformis]|uniref:SDR family NAD(P)-dependent oxidoreductase n=1 Tax=Amycolatopsis rhabdoformis TaxID=1448059 RepID=A0ABZ1IJF5_9PSEU|nr:SDR family NAD(P)-dependent oxidoreductase [Amycolatopsis rhabdoformis]WSE34590.1 SDR family NAD(P)-dependent oxidoreductase [Amycolatopsis rhabdoformis]